MTEQHRQEIDGLRAEKTELEGLTVRQSSEIQRLRAACNAAPTTAPYKTALWAMAFALALALTALLGQCAHGV